MLLYSSSEHYFPTFYLTHWLIAYDTLYVARDSAKLALGSVSSSYINISFRHSVFLPGLHLGSCNNPSGSHHRRWMLDLSRDIGYFLVFSVLLV